MTTPPSTQGRITQRRIAELAGVSQATVSLVLNGKADASSRIPEETRKRVLDVINSTTYVPDPAARRLAGVGNKIIGVFTYEPAFPSASLDFYAALLTGIESEAEGLGCDLLLFTSAPVEGTRRRLFHENNRLRLADGCLLLGREMDTGELERLVESGFPFVAIGRREATGVPYVAADYVTGTAALVARAWDLGHRRFAYVHPDSTGESVLDRQRGFREELARRGVDADAVTAFIASDGDAPAGDWERVRDSGATVLFVENPTYAIGMLPHMARAGVSIPGDLSVVALADPSRSTDSDPDFTRLSPPRTQLGSEALALLSRILDPAAEVPPADLRLTLDCAVHDGATLARPRTTQENTR
ncbi:LacI family DNA-binding transcriptional regulator [Microbacterium cremeum]|uniref:LacI family DNA-binding transcriptional regulator n=1 Tax=Microbacterium cremeum TaxID=2782169 RepID=UPI001886B12A|nr:LacI family DNA-binding transcriptional regulator [Microbacterium cremeum]